MFLRVRCGAPIAVLESGETKFLVELSRATEWKAKTAATPKSFTVRGSFLPSPPRVILYGKRKGPLYTETR